MKSYIKFTERFTDCPGGRARIHGDFSGEEFREDILKPALAQFDEVVLDLDGAFGFPSSFLDEAFGVLVQQLGLQKVKSKLRIHLTDDPLALREIDQVMNAHGCAN